MWCQHRRGRHVGQMIEAVGADVGRFDSPVIVSTMVFEPQAEVRQNHWIRSTLDAQASLMRHGHQIW